MPSKNHVIIIEDHPDVAANLQTMLNQSGKFAVMHIFYLAKEAAHWLETSKEKCPQLFLVDLGLPDENGIWLIEQILQKCKKAKIIVYTAFEAPELILRAIQAGAHGYLLKDTKKELLLHQIESVMLGAAAFTPRVADYILHSWMNLKSHKQLKRKNSFHPLTEREKEILLELANGLTIADISDIIGIQESTVKTHIRKIYEKLQVNNKTAAIQRGIDLGVIE